MTLKRTQVMLLPTNEKSSIGDFVLGINQDSKLMHFGKKVQEPYNTQDINYNLYFLSDEEIKDCWVYNKQSNEVYYLKGFYGIQPHCKKIIATTDSCLEIVSKGINPVYEKLPQPSQDFIKVFVEEYNKGNVIKWVDVEYETVTRRYGSCSKGEGVTMNVEQLKVNSKNEITIRKVKESWNREEVISKLKKLAEDIDEKYRPYTRDNNIGFDMVNNDGKWIAENL